MSGARRTDIRENKRRRESSEALLERSGFEIDYIEGAGHRMHWDAGRAHFWRLVCSTLAEKEKGGGSARRIASEIGA